MTVNGFFLDAREGNANTSAFRLAATTFSVEGIAGLVGMIDTGADLCRIDQGLADRLDLPEAGHMPSVLSGVRMNAPMRKATLVFPALNFRLSGAFPVAPLRNAGCQYDAILGMDFIRHFELRINAQTQLVEITKI